MKIFLIGRGVLHKLILPLEIKGDYWITQKNAMFSENLLNIFAEKHTWQIKSDHNVKIINPQCITLNNGIVSVIQNSSTVLNKIILKEYSMHCICIGNFDNIYILYCAPSIENNLIGLDASEVHEIAIGNDLNNQIYYNNSLVPNIHSRMNWLGNQWIFEDFGSQFGTFINGKPLYNTVQTLKNGDSIFIMGLSIIVLGRKLYINNPFNRVAWSTTELKPLDTTQTLYASIYNTNEEEQNINIYSEEDYYFRSPRMMTAIEPQKVKIDPPPTKKEFQDKSILLTLGTSLTMGTAMLVTFVSSVISLINGAKNVIPRLITSTAMAFGMIVLPMITRRVQKKQLKNNEKKRQEKYKEYLDSKSKVIDDIIKKQREILCDTYLSTEECVKIIQERNTRLWERRLYDKDFLTIRLGTGTCRAQITMQYPDDDNFSLKDDDELFTSAVKLGDSAAFIDDAPITLSLFAKTASAVVSKKISETENFMENIIIQLIALHSYQELKLVFLLKNSDLYWDYVKILPHIWNDERTMRFFATDFADMQEISTYLNDKFVKRMEEASKGSSVNTNNIQSPYYLIISDDYGTIENLTITTDILSEKSSMGFSFLFITDDLTRLPDECDSFIYLNGKDSKLYKSGANDTYTIPFSYDEAQSFFADKVAQSLANIPVRTSISKEYSLKDSFGFLEMYNAGKIEHLNILSRWYTSNDPTKSLKAQIGIDSLGMPIYLDIHEKFHGPHGLIAGSTGSGKSEFIITYILSLAVNYNPEDVSFVLIDYKGGGLAGAFQKREIKLPHLIGTITNIDTSELQRSLVAIKSELTRRQILFNEARNLIDEGTIDIYKYQKLYKQKIIDKPIPHLLIICDEFAELKQQQPEFMDELISVSRIGRSLGVHLILATQKPAGVVNDQIRSNSKFGVCLKVQDKADSNDVIKRPDAAFLKNPGQFYLNVGNEEYFVFGQSAWTGAQYFPTEVIKKKVDTSVEFISNIGAVLTNSDDSTRKVSEPSQGEQLTNILKYIFELSKKEALSSKNLWLDPIPETIYLNDLKEKYKAKCTTAISPVIGEFDDPSRQMQGLLRLNLNTCGNIALYGNAESGKETLLSTIIYELITSYSSKDIWLYILDFGTESLRIFKDAPHIGDIILQSESEKTSRFFELIQGELKSRKDKLSAYNGDFELYLKSTKEFMPRILVILNNFDVFSENYSNKYDDQLISLTRECRKYGILFLVTLNAANSMRYRLLQNFTQKISLQMNNDMEYASIFEKLRRRTLPKIFGRGFMMAENKEIYEFQTAKICSPEQWNSTITSTIEKVIKQNSVVAKRIPVLPTVVTLDVVKSYLKDFSNVPIGIDIATLSPLFFNFKGTFLTPILGKTLEDTIPFLRTFMEVLAQLQDVNITVFDCENLLESFPIETVDSYDKFFEELETPDSSSSKHKLYIFVGISKLMAESKTAGKNLKQLLGNAEATKKYSFIFFENAIKFKSFGFEEWYKTYIQGNTGLWIGSGAADQFIITFDINRRLLQQNLNPSFGFVTKAGKATFLKLLGIDDSGDSDE